MIIENFNPHSLDWVRIPSEKILGEAGFAFVKTQNVGDIKIRMIEYSPNYIADHWCEKGHIVHILHGELIIEYKDRLPHILNKDMSYVIGDNAMAHKVKTVTGATAFIID